MRWLDVTIVDHRPFSTVLPISMRAPSTKQPQLMNGLNGIEKRPCYFSQGTFDSIAHWSPDLRLAWRAGFATCQKELQRRSWSSLSRMRPISGFLWPETAAVGWSGNSPPQPILVESDFCISISLDKSHSKGSAHRLWDWLIFLGARRVWNQQRWSSAKSSAKTRQDWASKLSRMWSSPSKSSTRPKGVQKRQGERVPMGAPRWQTLHNSVLSQQVQRNHL